MASRCEAAGRFYDPGESRLIHYEQLPRAVWETLPNFWGVSYSSAEVEWMQAASLRNAKSPSRIFTEDRQIKRAAATEELRAVAGRWVMPHYERLEMLRRTQAD